MAAFLDCSLGVAGAMDAVVSGSAGVVGGDVVQVLGVWLVEQHGVQKWAGIPEEQQRMQVRAVVLWGPQCMLLNGRLLTATGSEPPGQMSAPVGVDGPGWAASPTRSDL